MSVRPKKYLGQHFLIDPNIARKIAGSIEGNPSFVLEVGPGTGALTRFLIERFPELKVIEIDTESVDALINSGTLPSENIIIGDFLLLNLEEVLPPSSCIVGNFPYNISSQIFFKILNHKHLVEQVVGMVQYEVAERIASAPGSKQYGILSVLLQTFYDIEFLFKVPPSVFFPPPKVNSAVIRLFRNKRDNLPCKEENYFRIVKTAFGQRRKMLRNTLRLFFPADIQLSPLFEKRPENLSVDDFIELTCLFESNGKV
ncbi:MAG: 16S rRNA (adenine(1518)-N(6)/adenine(1519)-N(6))-dimethyltransferase RsmA [Bacteroidales bacterium]|nr:16S rRNA (adenine(1518)-N(6)/adenine(1519)-N(6))-dimethyltransferase RsmA [Bacteroidales bacterium]